MGLMVTATNARQQGAGIWTFDMPPHQVRLFGGAASSAGARSVVLLKHCTYEETDHTLQFDLSDAVALNVGTRSEAIAIAADVTGSARGENAEEANSDAAYAPGDRDFLQMTKALLPVEMHRAAMALLAGVRQHSQGELKRGKAKNFSETPDNFWYVIIQPRVEQLSVTVRGTVDHFRPKARLPIKDDRGNTLFKITSEADVQPALDLIFHAKRRR